MKHRYSPSGPTLGTHQGEIPFHTRPVPFSAAPEPPGSPAFVVYKIGGDPADYQFMLEPPKEIPHGYTCMYVLDCNNLARTNQITAGGISGATGGISGTAGGVSGVDADKQAWLAKYATATNQQSSAPAAPTVDQISAILRDQFGMVPKRRAIGYSKPYPNEYDLIPLPPKYRLPEFSKFSGSEGSSSIEHVSRYLAQLGMISASDPLRVRFFAQSLTGSAFGWYTSLPPDSIRTWKQMEEQFHMQYHSEASEAGIADHTSIGHALHQHRTCVGALRAVPGTRAHQQSGSLPALRVARRYSSVGFGGQHILAPGGTFFYNKCINIRIGDGGRSSHVRRPVEEYKKKYDEIKALFETDLIGSFQRTRSHGIRWKGFSAEGALDGVDLSTPSEERTRSLRQEEIMKHQYSPSGPALGTHQGEVQSRPPLPFALAAPEVPSSPAYVVYKIGGDPSDYQFLYEPPKEIPTDTCAHMCQIAIAGAHEPGCNGRDFGTAGGISGSDLEKQAWLAKYATPTNHQSSTPAASTVDQISAILRDQFGMVPKRRAISYSKPYPNEYDLIPLPPKYRLPEFSKFSGSEGSSSVEHVWRQQIQMAIEQGRLIFSQYAMKVDTHPFPAVNMVECTYPGRCQPGFSFSINMVGPVYHPGDGKLGYGFTSADELEEVDIGPGDKPRPTFISKKLDPHLRSQMIALLKEYPDCFAWDYTEMPGLDKSIIEHRLPLKKGFRPFQQRARQMKADILEEVKKEVEKMLTAGFIRPCRYAEWISNIVPVQKKDGRWRVAIDFRDLNRATPKDEYPMPVAETLVNAAAGHKVLSFMDGNAGYNQIFMAPEDIHKTAFRVPGSVGLFEYVVMTFGLKNAGATYQRAMNYIFHDLIGKLVEIYIDDVVVKSVSVEGHLEDLRRILD
ncbi:hypothetical protein QYE76_013669 [Lolium multiflorum]|uniref:Reverse transcriptase domain-containing protein n=1 Tax=Lolium multiflorum TaxID=4521 RepID=A0AAD8U3D8_LOLMU|nr:hypothetical protein QYE76_013669 [Lolium multiflorum]